MSCHQPGEIVQNSVCAKRVFQGLWSGWGQRPQALSPSCPQTVISTARIHLSCVTLAVGAVEMWETREPQRMASFLMSPHPCRQGWSRSGFFRREGMDFPGAIGLLVRGLEGAEDKAVKNRGLLRKSNWMRPSRCVRTRILSLGLGSGVFSLWIW